MWFPRQVCFSHPLLSLQRRESICDSEAETNNHKWPIGAGHLTLKRTFAMNNAHVIPCDTLNLTPLPTDHHPAWSFLKFHCFITQKCVYLCQECVSHDTTVSSLIRRKYAGILRLCKWKSVTPNRQIHTSCNKLKCVWLLHHNSQHLCLISLRTQAGGNYSELTLRDKSVYLYSSRLCCHSWKALWHMKVRIIKGEWCVWGKNFV